MKMCAACFSKKGINEIRYCLLRCFETATLLVVAAPYASPASCAAVANALNQYTQRTVPGYAAIRGEAATDNVWGLDLDGTLQGAGGVGGLLAVVRDDGVFLPTYDANGNVSEYVSTNGEIVAHYDYSPFGEPLVASGELAASFTHQFSTKPYCPVTGFSEYQMRKYRSEIGRWISRDPIGYFNSASLFAFCRNRINLFDILGLIDECKCGDCELRKVTVNKNEMPDISIMTGLKMELVTTDLINLVNDNIKEFIAGKIRKELDDILKVQLFNIIDNFALSNKKIISGLFQGSGGGLIEPAVRYKAKVHYEQRRCVRTFPWCCSWAEWKSGTQTVKLDWTTNLYDISSGYDTFFMEARELFIKTSSDDFEHNISGVDRLIERIYSLIKEDYKYSRKGTFIEKLKEETKCKVIK